MKKRNLFFYFTTLLIFCACSKNSTEEPRTFVRLEVDGQVYEYFDDEVKRTHSFVSYGNTVGSLFDTTSSTLQGRPAFFISYSGPPGQKDGDFWITMGTYSLDNSPTSLWRAMGGDPTKRRFTVHQVSDDKKSWSGDFYYETEDYFGNYKIVKGTYAIVGK